MTAGSLAALFGAMIVLAATPSLSVLLVTTKSATSGFAHGASTAIGVVVGDLIFILLAVFGLALLVNAMEGTWFVLKYIAATYLIWIGLGLWRARSRPCSPSQPRNTSLQGSFMAGLLLTLADQKAFIFYLAFLPAFMDLAAFSWLDLGALVAVTIIAVGGVKLAYAYAAVRSGAFIIPTIGRELNLVAAGALLVAAVALVAQG